MLFPCSGPRHHVGYICTLPAPNCRQHGCWNGKCARLFSFFFFFSILFLGECRLYVDSLRTADRLFPASRIVGTRWRRGESVSTLHASNKYTHPLRTHISTRVKSWEGWMGTWGSERGARSVGSDGGSGGKGRCGCPCPDRGGALFLLFF